jgi:alpha-glucoside transport system substrate-binding protein
MKWVSATVLAVAFVASACGTTDEPAAKTVTVFAPYRTAEAAQFVADLDGWASRHHIDVRYTGSGNLASDLQHRVESADPPDIALVPQPGLVARFARRRKVRELAPGVLKVARRNIAPDALTLGEFDGAQVAFPFRISVKGLVWYRPSELEALHVEPPATLAGVATLVDRIEAKGRAPWCFGVEAQAATGWPATDWVENLVLRDWGPEVYDAWIDGSVPFRDPRIESSFRQFRDLVAKPGRLAGGVARAIATPVQTASAPLFQDPPGCALYQQASFALGWFPTGQTVSRHGSLDFFVLPARSGKPPLVVGTDLAVAFAHRPEVDEVMRFLATPEAVKTWVHHGGFLSPQLSLVGAYPQRADRRVVDELRHASTVVLDASDAMPPRIGSDLFLTQITKWLARAITYDKLAATLDSARA